MNEFVNNTKSFFVKCRRVWQVLKKPTTNEFWTVTKISAIGILIIGAVGFAISIAVNSLLI